MKNIEIGCLLTAVGLLSAGAILWIVAAGWLGPLVDGLIWHPLSLDGAITAALVVGVALGICGVPSALAQRTDSNANWKKDWDWPFINALRLHS
jgi:hypothetical protein